MRATRLRLVCAPLCMGLPFGALAQDAGPVPAPALKVGDAWVFDEVNERGTTGFNQRRLDFLVERLDGETMAIGVKPDGAPTNYEDHIVGADWSQRRMVDGHNMVTTRPFEFPMKIGQKWTVDYVDPLRRGNQLSAHIHRTYTVAGWQDVTVPAGSFHAIKVVADGVDEAQVEVPAMAGTASVAGSGGATSVAHAQRGGVGKVVRGTHAELYYVPSVKYLVRSIEEQYNADNVRVSRMTLNLVSFKPGA